jgi:hypothetical protein
MAGQVVGVLLRGARADAAPRPAAPPQTPRARSRPAAPMPAAAAAPPPLPPPSQPAAPPAPAAAAQPKPRTPARRTPRRDAPSRFGRDASAFDANGAPQPDAVIGDVFASDGRVRAAPRSAAAREALTTVARQECYVTVALPLRTGGTPRAEGAAASSADAAAPSSVLASVVLRATGDGVGGMILSIAGVTSRERVRARGRGQGAPKR